MLMKFITVIILLFGLQIALHSQESGQSERKQSDPVELPGFIIEGIEKLSIRSGVKQSPRKTPALTKSELDTLNNLEKRAPQMIPAEALPDKSLARIFDKGFLTADLGRFSTVDLNGGYLFNIDEYSIFGNAGLAMSSGHIDNAGYFDGYVNLKSDYIAPKKFWIFGGSLTTSKINLGYKEYELYASANPKTRGAFNMALSIDSEGNYDGYLFGVGAKFETLQFTKETSSFDNWWSGYFNIKSFWKGYLVGADIEVNAHSVNGKGTSFLQLSGFGSYDIEGLTLRLDAGFQAATTTNEVSNGGVMFAGRADYRMSRFFTIIGEISSGFANNSFISLAKINPYIVDTIGIEYRKDALSLGGKIAYHPDTKLSIVASAYLKVIDRLPYFESKDTATFFVGYQNAKNLELNLESIWELDSDNTLVGSMSILSSKLDDFSSTPHLPGLVLSASYLRNWNTEIGTQIGVIMYGERYADIENKRKIDNFININGSIEYRIDRKLKIIGKFDNLFNSQIVYWEGFKERSAYFSIGVNWLFN